MAGQFVTDVNDAYFEKEVLQSDAARFGGFLGRVVRPVPRARPGGG